MEVIYVKFNILLLNTFAFFEINADSTSVIEVTNKTDMALDVQHSVPIPEYTHVIITTQLTHLKPSSHVQDMLHKAIIQDSVEGVMQSIQAGADVNLDKDNKSPLVWAVLLKRFMVIEALLKYGANVNVVYLGLPLIQHVYNKGVFNKSDMKLAFSLLLNGATVSSVMQNEIIDKGFSNSALTTHVWNRIIADIGSADGVNNCKKEFFKLLVMRGLDPNKVLDHGEMPLILAIRSSNLESVKTLVLVARAGVNYKATTMHHSTEGTPLSYALETGNGAIIEFLLELGATL